MGCFTFLHETKLKEILLLSRVLNGMSYLRTDLALSFGSRLLISFLINDVTKPSSFVPATRTRAAADKEKILRIGCFLSLKL